MGGGVMSSPVGLPAAVLLALGLAGGAGALLVQPVPETVSEHRFQLRASGGIFDC
jgi:hypothetical protein